MDRLGEGLTDVLDVVSFGLIGVAVMAVGVASLGRVPEASVRVPAAVEVAQAAVYDVELTSAAAWLGDADAPSEDRAQDAIEPVSPEPAAAPPPIPVASAAEVVADAAPPEVRRAPPRREADGRALPPRKAAAAGGRSRGKRCEEAPDPLITAVDGGFVVREAVVQRYTRDWSRLDELGWSEVHRGADGKADGMRIGGIRCGSDPWDAGFRTGDVIHAVNGRKVRSIPGALAAYAALHGQREFSVELTRAGQRRTVRFTLVRAG